MNSVTKKIDVAPGWGGKKEKRYCVTSIEMKFRNKELVENYAAKVLRTE